MSSITTLNETPSARDDDGSSSAPVPDVLLSLAKDDRYISQITALLGQSMVSLASVLLPQQRRQHHVTNRNNDFDTEEIIDDDGRRFIERIQPELHFLAAVIVHSATFVFYTRNFGDTGVANNHGGVRRSMGMESLNLAYTFPKNGDSVNNSAGGASSNASVGLNYGNRVKELLIRVFNAVSLDRWQMLLFLQTVIQYLIQRAGRGGWSKDLGEILSTALRCLGWHAGSRLDGRATNGLHRDEITHDDTIRNDDRLRGSQRRRLFEEQRRRMMSAAHSDRTEQVDTTDAVEQGNVNNNERSTRLETTQNSRLIERAKAVAEYSWEFLRRVSLAFSSLSHGAHTLARQDETVDTSHFDRYTNMLKWLLRLHLALYYWNGMYPTIYHRLVGAKIRDNVPPYNSHTSLGPNAGAVVANRPTYKPVAVLIFLQAATALAQSVAEVSIELIHNIQVAFFRWRRQRNRGINGITNNPFNVGYNSERQVYLDLVEERVPSVVSSKDDSHASTKQRKKQSQSNKKSPTIHPCGICLNERVHPAASVCGHVFCWNCILHWVSNVREECPLCRAPTRPQDVLPLYNYP